MGEDLVFDGLQIKFLTMSFIGFPGTWLAVVIDEGICLTFRAIQCVCTL